MKKVEFKYDLDQKVRTPFGEPGIVLMLGLDGNGNLYFVKTVNKDQWFKEGQLSVNASIVSEHEETLS